MTEEHRTRWQELTGGTTGAEYAARISALAASGRDLHGEATLCASLVSGPARVLDAGCGTGRVGLRLAELGYDVVGVDADESMLAVAREQGPQLTWVHADLADLSAQVTEASYDLVILAGNVVPLLAPGTLPAVMETLASLLAPGGSLVAGFGLDREHLPAGCPVTTVAEYDAACAHLVLEDRFATWDQEPFTLDAGYAVSVHRRC
jgi:SAM-dependent methyltransferase